MLVNGWRDTQVHQPLALSTFDTRFDEFLLRSQKRDPTDARELATEGNNSGS